MSEWKKYSYTGPVEVFGKCVDNQWYGSTYATSEKKARSNLKYQYKKQLGKTAATKVTLPGKIVVVE
jgi:hypothetical protein